MTAPEGPPEPSVESRAAMLSHELTELRALARRAEARAPAWLRPHAPENRLPVVAAILVAIGLQLSIPDKYGLHPRWLIPALELILLIVLSVINPIRLNRATTLGKYASLALVAAITLDNGVSAALLAHDIITTPATGGDGAGLLASGGAT
jgi:hypothetical protein